MGLHNLEPSAVAEAGAHVVRFAVDLPMTDDDERELGEAIALLPGYRPAYAAKMARQAAIEARNHPGPGPYLVALVVFDEAHQPPSQKT